MVLLGQPDTHLQGEMMEPMLERQFSWKLYQTLLAQIQAAGGGYPELHKLLDKNGKASDTLIQLAKMAVIK